MSRFMCSLEHIPKKLLRYLQDTSTQRGSPLPARPIPTARRSLSLGTSEPRFGVASETGAQPLIAFPQFEETGSRSETALLPLARAVSGSLQDVQVRIRLPLLCPG